MNPKSLLLAGTLLTTALAARADGTITWAWSCAYGADTIGSGTFTSDATETTSGGNTGSLAREMTGTIGIYSVTGLGAIGDAFQLGAADNLLIPTSATTATVDSGGIDFYLQGSGEGWFFKYEGTTALLANGSGSPIPLSITEVSESVPEPGVTALAAAGGLGLLGFRRRKQ